MRTRNFDPNEQYACREKFCKCGISTDTTAFLPIKRPPAYKSRVAGLYARYKSSEKEKMIYEQADAVQNTSNIEEEL